MANIPTAQSVPPSPGITLPQLQHGYPTLADDMTRTPAKIHFRSFLADYVQQQLHAQAEVIECIDRLRQVQQEDANSSDPDRRNYTREWSKTMASGGRQYKIGIELRGRLDDYMDRLIRLSHVCDLPKPNTGSDLHGVQNFIGRELNAGRPGNNRWLRGSERQRDIWGYDDARDSYEPDLTAVKAHFRNDVDKLSRWAAENVATRVVSQFKEPVGDQVTILFDDDTVQQIVGALQCTLGSLIPMAAVVTLYAVKSTIYRLLALAIWDLVFVWSIASITQPRVSEIFGVSAAFLSVGVVFIGGGVGSPGYNVN